MRALGKDDGGAYRASPSGEGPVATSVSTPADTRQQALLTAFALSSDGFAIVAADDSVVRVNRAWLGMHGFEPEDEASLVGSLLSQFHSRVQMEQEVYPLLERAAMAGTAQGLVGHVRADGSSFHTWTTVAAAGVDPASGYVVMSRDLSAEPTAANALRRTGGFLHSVVETMPDMVFVRDAVHLRVVLVNRAGETFLGRSRSELIGKSDFDLFAKEEAECRAALDRLALETAGVTDVPEQIVNTPLGGPRWVHTKRVPIRDASGKARYLLELAEDVTDRRACVEAQSHLQLARMAVRIRDEVVEESARALRSELRLAVFEAESALHHESDSLSDRLARRFKNIYRSMQEIDTYVSRALGASRVLSEPVGLAAHVADLAMIVRTVAGRCSQATARGGSELVVVAPDPVHGRWEIGLIEDVVEQLLRHAFNTAGGKLIHVTVTAEEDGMARLTVRGDGIGRAATEQQDAPDRPARADSASRSKEDGSGLSMVRHIVGAHRGSLRVSSSPGTEDVLTVELPQRLDET